MSKPESVISPSSRTNPSRGRPGTAGRAAAGATAVRPSGGGVWRTFGVIVLFFVSVGVLFTVLQVTGLWDWLNPLTRRVATWPAVAPHVEMYRLGREEWQELQGEQARLAEWETVLRLEAERLAQEERALRAAQNELNVERSRLQQWETELAARQSAVERLEDEYEALERLREVYESMRPQEAARILADMTVDEVALLLEDMDPRTTAAILAAFPVDKATEVSRLLGF